MWGAIKNLQDFTVSSLDKAQHLLDTLDDRVGEELERDERVNFQEIEPYAELENVTTASTSTLISEIRHVNHHPSVAEANQRVQNHTSSSSNQKSADDSWDFDDEVDKSYNNQKSISKSSSRTSVGSSSSNTSLSTMKR